MRQTGNCSTRCSARSPSGTSQTGIQQRRSQGRSEAGGSRRWMVKLRSAGSRRCARSMSSDAREAMAAQ